MLMTDDFELKMVVVVPPFRRVSTQPTICQIFRCTLPIESVRETCNTVYPHEFEQTPNPHS
jgi:hypothetical protein